MASAILSVFLVGEIKYLEGLVQVSGVEFVLQIATEQVPKSSETGNRNCNLSLTAVPTVCKVTILHACRSSLLNPFSHHSHQICTPVLTHAYGSSISALGTQSFL